MAVTTRTVSGKPGPGLAGDPLVDGQITPVQAAPIEAMNGVSVDPAADPLPAAEAASPVSWWLVGLIALAVVIAILFAMQWFGGAPGTDVQSGTPTAQPVVPSATNP